MKNYKPKVQDVVRFTYGGSASDFRLVKPMSEKDCEQFGVRWTVDGQLQGSPWLAKEIKSGQEHSLLFGKIVKAGDSLDLSEHYVLLEREGIAWQS